MLKDKLLQDLQEHFETLGELRNLAQNYDERLFNYLLEESKYKEEFKNRFFIFNKKALIFKINEFLTFLDLKNLSGSFTSYANKIGLANKTKSFLKTNNEVVLNFAFKDGVIKGGQSKDEQKTQEIFFNEILARDEIDTLFAPKALQNFKLIGENKNLQEYLKDNPNLLIKGNNLLVLHSLKKLYTNKVKLIYIDPPYNTGSDSFKYNDKFNHSTWLTFMKNRLEIAREFLSDDGVIFVQCDDNEQAYLKVLMDEIFGRENFVNSIIWRYRTYQGQVRDFFPRKHDVILWYKKLNRPTFRLSYQNNYKETVDYERWKEFYVEDKIIYPNYPKTDSRFDAYLQKYINKNGEPKNGDIIYRVKGYVVDDVWEDIKAIDAKNKTEKIEFSGGQKPEQLIQRILHSVTNENDIVMDFFAGSGTTLAVAHKMKRKWIGIEQMDYIKDITKERLKKVVEGEQGGISKAVNWQGGGNFVYAELMPLNAIYKEKIQNLNDEKELDNIYQELKTKAFLDYRVDIQDILKDKDFKELSLEDKKQILNLALDSNMDYVLYGDIKDKDYDISKETIKLNEIFYGDENV